MRAALGLLALLASGPWLAGCVGEPGVLPGPPFGELADFVAQAQPILAERCANPSCHGTAARPLSLFAVHQHRMRPQDTYLDAPLSEEELAHNHTQASAFLLDVSDAEHSLLLRKPLAVAAGGSGHVGGAQFHDASDHGYRQLHAWASEALAARP